MFAFKDRVHYGRFEEVLKQGKRVHGSLVYIQFLKNDLERSRFSAVVPKSVAKKAIERTKLKRKIRETVRAQHKQFPEGFDYLVFAKKEIVDANSEKIQKDVKDIIVKIL